MKDPVCGMQVNEEGAAGTTEYSDETYYFCSKKCLQKFEAAPEKHLEERNEAPPAGDQRIYTCPMHPEIEQVGPGDCPKCGMALEPKGVPTGDEGPNPELVDFTRRFWIGA